jgi:multiple sugar transport system permease protein
MSALLVPVTAITLPLYLVYAKVGLINSIWGMILPSMVTPVAVYLMRTFIDAAVPRELIDAARIDGAGEVRILLRVGLPLMVPGLVTVLLLSIVGVWNNYFLPLIIFSRSSLYPLTVGLGLLSQHAEANGTSAFVPLVVIGALITIIPLIILFLVLQRYWRGGLLLGGITG